MKKSFVSILTGLFMLGIAGSSWAVGVTATDVQCNPAGCVNPSDIAASSVETAKIADLNVTEAKIANLNVTEGKIADGAVTDIKISGIISGSKLGTHTHNGSDIVDGTISTSKIGTGAVDTGNIADIAITTGKIADGAVTDAKLTGPISVSKIEKPANVITVATSGGDFTTITAALASLPDPNTTPVVIKVMPGTYIESSITMKSNVNLQGAGRDVTIIQSPNNANDVVDASYLTNVAISGFTFSGGRFGLNTYDTTVYITENSFAGNDYGIGFCNPGSSSAIISNNLITNNTTYGIFSQTGCSSNSTIINNIIRGSTAGIFLKPGGSSTIKGNLISANYEGIHSESSSTISDNQIVDNISTGITVAYGGSPNIYRNTITGNNQGGVQQDIHVNASSANVSFNVYDVIYVWNGGSTTGLYNVKSDGTPAPLQ